ncbi:MAG: sulfatase [Myxococcales bacterium]
MSAASHWASRAVVGVLVLCASIGAIRTGGGTDARLIPPSPQRAGPEPPKDLPRGNEAYQVVLRLSEALGEARIDAPNLRPAQPYLLPFWRKIPGPWVRHAGDAGLVAWSVALRTSASELQWMVPTGTGRAWTPDARVWNMNEGSFDQREALFAPTPATLGFRLTVPPRAKLAVSPALMESAGQATVFTVSVADTTGDTKVLATRRLGPSEARRWFDLEVDLSAHAGQSVELRLTTSMEGERRPEATQEKGRSSMALALWGTPTLLAKAPTAVPYNVLWIVIDALRPDVLASFHDDAEDLAKANARVPPLDALLPKVPGLTPFIDALTARGVRFSHAYSNGAWTRPGTLAMLSGCRSTELGVDTLSWVVPNAQASRFYGSDPPLLPLLLRKQGVVTRAFVNNFFMMGHAAVGIDMGFERVDDHRYRTRDTSLITADTLEWLRAHRDERFFAFVNYNSPHDPYDPLEEHKLRVPPAPVGPKDPTVRAYMAEAAKDDEAVGVLLDALDQLKLREQTLVVLTADHGETLSAAHGGVSPLDHMPIRFHHAVSNFEETTRVPIVLSLPGVLPSGAEVRTRVRNIDLAPTILELLGRAPLAKMTGRTLLPLLGGEQETEERVVLTEGRGTRGLMHKQWRLIARDMSQRFLDAPGGAVTEELYDLETDPGERRNLAKERPEITLEMRARLRAALANVPVAGEALATTVSDTATLHWRFAGGGRVHRVSGTLQAGTSREPARVEVEPIGLAREAFGKGAKVDFAFTTVAEQVVGVDFRIEPSRAEVRWTLFLDDEPWPEGRLYAGAFGLLATASRGGLTSEDAVAEVYSPVLPEVDPLHDLGLFVTRDRRGDLRGPERSLSGEGAREMNRILQDWGYAHGSKGAAP